MWLTIIKYTHSRSLFKALKMLCFNKYKSNLRTLRGKTWRHKMFSIILWSSLTSQNKKDIHLLIDAAAGSCLIVLLFHSFESSSKRSHLFQNEWIPNLVITLPAVLHAPHSEVNTQRNKSSLLCTKSSSNTHFSMTHLNQHEVVMNTENMNYWKTKQKNGMIMLSLTWKNLCI